MTRLNSFGQPAHVAVIGASGGIGRAFCELLADDSAVARVYEFSRTDGPAASSKPKATRQFIDMKDERAVAAAANTIAAGSLDLVLVATGLLHRGVDLQPERRLQELDPKNAAEILAVNALGPTLIAKHFLPRLRRKGKTVFAALSARVGSIGDNRLGGWASYRAAKAALNQFVRTISIEHARQRPESIVISLHPGTVKTRLSQPFTSRTPSESLFAPQQAAANLLDVIDRLTPENSGGLFAWDGSQIEF